jgi:hypothetical protein
MYKGLVIKLTEEYAIVLAEEGNYCRIIWKEGLCVGQKIFFFAEDILGGAPAGEDALAGQFGLAQKKVRNSPRRLQKVRNLLALTACFLFFFLFGNILGLPANEAYYAIVSVDINPSVELKINQDKYVAAVDILNQEGFQVAGRYLIGLKVEEAVNRIVSKAVENNYLTAEETVLLAAALNPASSQSAGEDNGTAAEREFERELIENLSAAGLPEEYSYLYLAAEEEDYLQAKETGLSLGKYEMARNTQVKPAEAKNMKVEELLAQSDSQEKSPSKQIWLEIRNKKLKDQEEQADRGKKTNNYKDRIKEWKENLKNLKDLNKKDKKNDSADPRNPKGNKDSRGKERENQGKDSYSKGQDNKSNKKDKDNKNNKNRQDGRESKNNKDNKDGQESKNYKDSKDRKDSRYNRYDKAYRDNNNGKDRKYSKDR